MLHHMLRAAAQRAFSTLDPYFKYVTMLLHGDGSALGSDTVTPFNSDASSSARNVTINGDARSNNFNPYQEGYYSNYFDGSGDYLTCSSSATNFGTASFTIEFWVNFASLPSSGNNYNIISSTVTNGVEVLYRGTGSYIEIGRYGVGPSLQYSWTPSIGSWNHVAFVRNGTTITIYINGTSVTSGTVSQDFQTGTTNIGSAGGSQSYFAGYLSNVRVVKSTAVYTSNFTPSTTPLTAITNTSLLTCQSNRFIDNSTNAFTITKNGDTAVSPAQPFTLPSSVATYGSGYFDGSGDYLTAPDSASTEFGSGDFTVECWAYYSSTSGTPVLIDKRSSTAGYSPFIFYTTGGTLVFYSSSNGSSYDIANGVTIGSVTTGTWYHVAASRSGTSIRLFLNGVLGNTVTTSASLVNNSDAWSFGGTPGGNYLTGYLSNIRFVTGSAVYTSAFTPPTSPLTAITNTSLLTTQYNGAGNNSGFKDSSQNNFPITRNGNTTQGTFTPYGSNWSNYFNGGRGFTLSGIPISTSTYTIEAWVNVPSTTGLYCFYSQATAGNGNRSEFYINVTSGSASLNLYTPAGSLTSSSTFSSNTWTHVVVQGNGSSTAMYINGVAAGSTTAITIQSTAGAIGEYLTNGELFVGYISNLRITNTNLYSGSFTPSTTPLTAVTGTTLLTCQSNRFVDNSSSANTITVQGSPSVQRFSPFSPTTAYSTSVIGGSGYFDGSGDYLSIADNPALNLSGGAFTIEAWVYPNRDYSTFQTIITKRPSDPLCAWQMYISATSGYLGFYNGTVYASSSKVPLNQWSHCAAVYDGTNINLYLNGVRVLQSATGNTDRASAIQIGYFFSSVAEPFQGYMGGVRVVKGTAVYTGATYTVPTAPLTAVSGTSLLLSYTNAGILDNAMMNDLETVGNAQISTSVKKYGTGSIYLDGTGDYLNCANPANVINQFGTGDFTVEFWAYLTNSGNDNGPIFDTRSTSGNGLLIRQGNGAGGIANRIDAVITGSATASSGTISFNTWIHVAVVRSSGTLKVYYNGTGGTGVTATGNITGTNAYIGAFFDGLSVNIAGYFDDFRVTKGVARYTTTFTPPTAAFPNN